MPVVMFLLSGASNGIEPGWTGHYDDPPVRMKTAVMRLVLPCL